MTCPVPESVKPFVRLIQPPGVAVMVPWQLTGSVIVPQPPKPVPAETFKVVPKVCVRPRLEKL